MKRSIIIGCGGYLPKNVITNDDLSKMVETSDDWIFQRTGIKKRHFADKGEVTSDLGVEAARNALKTAELTPESIDLLVLATATPDETFPSTATIIQRKLGMKRGLAFDVSAVCAGYLTALNVADTFLKTGQATTALVIGSETFSRILDMGDRRTCVLFGDGAGAVILRSERFQPENASQSGILGISLQSDGNFHDILYVDGGPSSTGQAGVVRMIGQEVFRHAVTKLAESAESILKTYNTSKEEIDWLIPHQANIRIIEGLAKRFNVPWEKVIHTVSEHANTSAASIPLALSKAYEDHKLKKGDLILHDAIGSGLVWGSALVRW